MISRASGLHVNRGKFRTEPGDSSPWCINNIYFIHAQSAVVNCSISAAYRQACAIKTEGQARHLICASGEWNANGGNSIFERQWGIIGLVTIIVTDSRWVPRNIVKEVRYWEKG